MKQESKKWPQLPPWITLSVALGALVLGAVIFSRDYRRERALLNSIFMQRGELLIHALEMVGRMRFEERQPESLALFWDNLEKTDNVLFMAITDKAGRPLALAGDISDASIFSNPSPDAPETGLARRRVERLAGEPAYLVYRRFRPMPPGRMRHNMMTHGHRQRMGMGMGMGMDASPAEAPLPRYAWVGFNMAPFEAASRERTHTAALFALLFCLAALGGVLALFWGHNSRLSRRMYEDIKAELEQKRRLATLGGLAAGLAHEIRNPLGAIGGLSQHLLNRGAYDGADRESLEVILKSVRRLNSTITDFLDYARPTEIKPGPVDLAGLLRHLSALTEASASERKVELELDLPQNPLLIEGDESRLAQAFLNLYLNAAQAAGQKEGGRLAVTLARQGETAVITFRDNGPGFSPEQLAQAFVPYFTTKAEGTGLGLALAEKCVLAHGGTISLASPAGGGALVTVRLKAEKKE